MALKRLQIIQAIKSRFDALINGTGGYYTNLTGKVFTFRTSPFQAHEIPGLNITRSLNEFGSELMGPVPGKHDQVLSVDVEFVCMQAATSHELAEKIIADIYKAIGDAAAGGPTWGGLAHDTVPVSDEVDVVEDSIDGGPVRVVGGGKVTFVVHYRTSHWSEE